MKRLTFAAACLLVAAPLAFSAVSAEPDRPINDPMTSVYGQPAYYAPVQTGSHWWTHYQAEHRALRAADGGTLTPEHRTYLARRKQWYRHASS